MSKQSPNESSSSPRWHKRQVKRVLILVAVGAALGFVGLIYRHFWLSRPSGHGPAGPSVSSEAFRQPWTVRSLTLLGLGDSVTAGFGARRGYSYFDRLAANPPDEFADLKGICLNTVLPNLQTKNLAISGSTSLEHLEKLLPKIETARSNVLGFVVITSGGNDLIHNYGRTPPREGAMYGATFEEAKPWIGDFEQRLESAIRRIKACFPGGCHIFLANIYDPTDGVGDIERAGLPAWKDGPQILRAYNTVIARCVQKNQNTHLVNLHDTFLGHGIHCAQFWSRHYRHDDPHYWYHDNLEDPNERGYDAIRRLFLIEMAKIAKELK